MNRIILSVTIAMSAFLVAAAKAPTTKETIKFQSVESIFSALPYSLRPRTGESPSNIQLGKITDWIKSNAEGQKISSPFLFGRAGKNKSDAFAWASLFHSQKKPRTSGYSFDAANLKWTSISVSAKFSESDLDRLGKMKEGEKIRVVGEIEEIAFMGTQFELKLKDCSIR